MVLAVVVVLQIVALDCLTCVGISFGTLLFISYSLRIYYVRTIYSGASWNEFNNYQYQTFASQLLNSIASPSSGALYFFLFLVYHIFLVV